MEQPTLATALFTYCSEIPMPVFVSTETVLTEALVVDRTFNGHRIMVRALAIKKKNT